MDRYNQIRSQLISTFQAEMEDHLANLNGCFLALEKNPAADARESLLTEIFRSAHTLKGAARAVEIKEIESLAHKLEDTIVVIRTLPDGLESWQISLLLSILDNIRDAMSAFLNGEVFSEERLNNLYDHLAQGFQDPNSKSQKVDLVSLKPDGKNIHPEKEIFKNDNQNINRTPQDSS